MQGAIEDQLNHYERHLYKEYPETEEEMKAAKRQWHIMTEDQNVDEEDALEGGNDENEAESSKRGSNPEPATK